MTERDDKLIKYEPLRNLLGALEDEDNEGGEAGLRSSLEARGYDPDAVVKAVQTTVEQGIKRHRLAWKQVARATIARLQSIRSEATTWSNRTHKEIEEAFRNVVRGAFGRDAQVRVQAAFRNLDNVSPEDKASFLDDLDALERMTGTADESKEQ